MQEPLTQNPSLWTSALDRVDALPLAGSIDVDVAIVGGGITGVTCALILREAGKRVALLDMDRIGRGTTGSTSAHVTEAVDARYLHIERSLGKDAAKLVAEGSTLALRSMSHFVEQLVIDCEWRRVPGYLFTEHDKDLEMLHLEHDAANRAGLATTMTREVPLPFATKAAVVFDRQAEFHPAKYLNALIRRFRELGGQVFEGTRVQKIDEGPPCVLHAEGGSVRAAHVVVATNNPLSFVFLQTKVASYRSYVVAARVKAPRLDGLFWDTDDPYHYVRSAPAHDGAEGSFVIAGGGDHKTGTVEDTEGVYAKLVDWTSQRFVAREMTHRWSAQVLEPVDGLPYIGTSSSSDNVHYATGFSGNGLTFGTLAAKMIADAILGRPNRWSEIFDAKRIRPLASAKEFLRENADVPAHLVGDRLRKLDVPSTEDVKKGEGKITSVEGKRCAVYRHDDGHLTVLSPVCPHLGCHVHFNDAEKTWDCPCHGSRFDVEGVVRDGPATHDLAKVETAKG